MKSDLSPQTTKWWFATVIVVCLALQGYGHRCGLLFTDDSANYVSASQSFKTDGSFQSPDGSLFTYWPPLFPITLSFFDSPEHATPWMYGVVTILIGLLSILILNRILESNLYKVVVLLLSMGSVQFMMISVFLWSEMNFLLLVLCVTVCALNVNKSKKYFIALLAFAFLMCLQRNAGVFILTGVCCWILLDKAWPLKARVTKSLLVFGVGITGLIAWNVYLSYGIESGFFFYKHEFVVHALENFSSVSTMLVRMFVPVSGILTSLLGVLLLAALILRIRKATREVQLIGLLILFYWIGLICMFKLDIYDVDRFLTILVFFIYLLVAERIEKGSQQFTKPVRRIFFSLLLMWMIYPFYRTVTNLKQWNSKGCTQIAQNMPLRSAAPYLATLEK